MTITGILAIFGGIAAAAAAIKGVPIIWNGLKNIFSFFSNITHVPEFDVLEQNQQTLLEGHTQIITSIEEIKSQQIDFNNIRSVITEFKGNLDQIAIDAIELAVTGFKSHTSQSSMPSFVLANKHGTVRFIWANGAWYQLHGIDYVEAMNGQYWECVSEDDIDRVRESFKTATENMQELKVTYTHTNLKTKQSCLVTANSWPLVLGQPKEDQEIVFLGGMIIL